MAKRMGLVASLALGLATLLPPASASADDAGSKGRVTRVRVNTSGSTEHATFHGSVTIRLASGKLRTYLWGGSTCPGQKLEEDHVRLLVGAQRDRGRTWLAPYYVASEGGDRRCLVAFELIAG